MNMAYIRWCMYVLLLLHVTPHYVISVERDPCKSNQHTVLNDRPSRDPALSYDGDSWACDRYQIDHDFWYRFGGDGCATIPEGYIPLQQCGTFVPIYVNHTYETENSTDFEAFVCAHVLKNQTCSWNATIKAKRCLEPYSNSGRNFTVYQLHLPPYCPMAYCAEEHCEIPTTTTTTTTTATSTTTTTVEPTTTPKDVGPSVIEIENGGNCDLTNSNCQDIRLPDAMSTTHHTRVCNITKDGHTELVYGDVTKGYLVCRAQQPFKIPGTYKVSVKFGNNAPTRVFSYTVYDSRCQHCLSDGSSTCTVTNDMCFIEGQCLASNAPNQVMDCLHCDPTKQNKKWSVRQGASQTKWRPSSARVQMGGVEKVTYELLTRSDTCLKTNLDGNLDMSECHKLDAASKPLAVRMQVTNECGQSTVVQVVVGRGVDDYAPVVCQKCDRFNRTLIWTIVAMAIMLGCSVIAMFWFMRVSWNLRHKVAAADGSNKIDICNVYEVPDSMPINSHIYETPKYCDKPMID